MINEGEHCIRTEQGEFNVLVKQFVLPQSLRQFLLKTIHPALAEKPASGDLVVRGVFCISKHTHEC